MQISGEMRREIAASYLRRMGRAKRNPSSSAPSARGIDGYRFAPPILRNPPNGESTPAPPQPAGRRAGGAGR
jgi:hypothetical protein